MSELTERDMNVAVAKTIGWVAVPAGMNPRSGEDMWYHKETNVHRLCRTWRPLSSDDDAGIALDAMLKKGAIHYVEFEWDMYAKMWDVALITVDVGVWRGSASTRAEAICAAIIALSEEIK